MCWLTNHFSSKINNVNKICLVSSPGWMWSLSQILATAMKATGTLLKCNSTFTKLNCKTFSNPDSVSRGKTLTMEHPPSAEMLDVNYHLLWIFYCSLSNLGSADLEESYRFVTVWETCSSTCRGGKRHLFSHDYIIDNSNLSSSPDRQTDRYWIVFWK